MRAGGKIGPALVAAVFFALAISASAADSTNRPIDWARKITLSGVPNFYQVTTNLYRGAQPTAEGMKQLKAKGIKTVISLREFHSDKNIIDVAGLKSVRLVMSPLHANEDEVVAFLKVATDTNNLPVFVHCERGADRTGTMCAMYRISVCGWTKEQAIEEMKNGGFDFSPVWQNLVEYIENADITDIKRRAGLAGR
jgi:protein tyrosine/serine phosphatase